MSNQAASSEIGGSSRSYQGLWMQTQIIYTWLFSQIDPWLRSQKKGLFWFLHLQVICLLNLDIIHRCKVFSLTWRCVFLISLDPIGGTYERPLSSAGAVGRQIH
jgi:hypothetical protein